MLHEKIEAIPAKTDAGRRVKARAVQMALRFDPASECDMSGSFVTLSQSLCRDLLAAASGDQSPSDRLTAAIAKVAEARTKEHPLSALIDAQRRAFVEFEEISDFSDFISKDDPSFTLLEDECGRRSDAETAAMLAVCAYPARTLEEARHKAKFLLKAMTGCVVDEDQSKALLRSVLPVEAGGDANG